MRHIYDNGETKIVVEIHDNAPNYLKEWHINKFERLVALHLRNIEKAKE